MAKIEKIGNIQVVDNKEDRFFCFSMISMACTGSGYNNKKQSIDKLVLCFFIFIRTASIHSKQNLIS